jgi:hypothetical protein
VTELTSFESALVFCKLEQVTQGYAWEYSPFSTNHTLTSFLRYSVCHIKHCPFYISRPGRSNSEPILSLLLSYTRVYHIRNDPFVLLLPKKRKRGRTGSASEQNSPRRNHNQVGPSRSEKSKAGQKERRRWPRLSIRRRPRPLCEPRGVQDSRRCRPIARAASALFRADSRVREPGPSPAPAAGFSFLPVDGVGVHSW